MSCLPPIIVLETLSRGFSVLLHWFNYVNRDELALSTLSQWPNLFLVTQVLLINILDFICIAFESSHLPMCLIIVLEQRRCILGAISLDSLVTKAQFLTFV